MSKNNMSDPIKNFVALEKYKQANKKTADEYSWLNSYPPEADNPPKINKQWKVVKKNARYAK